MDSTKRIERKVFITWALSSASAVALGCSGEAEPSSPIGVGGAGAGSGGTERPEPTRARRDRQPEPAAPSRAGGTAPSGGTFGSSGSAGTATTGGSSGAAGSGGSGGSAVAPNCSTQLKTFISANHMHVFEVTTADVMAGVTKVYDTKGLSMHTHFVQLTAADFAKLQMGKSVHKVSCNDGHEHEFIVNCLGNDKPDTTSGVANFCDPDHKCAESMTNVCPEIP